MHPSSDPAWAEMRDVPLKESEAESVDIRARLAKYWLETVHSVSRSATSENDVADL